MATDSATESENSMWTVWVFVRGGAMEGRFRVEFEFLVVILFIV